MQPTSGNIFVEKIPRNIKKNQFEYVEPHKNEKVDYKVVAVTDVKCCRVGDFILFNNWHELQFQDKTIIQVSEGDVVGVSHAS